MNQQYHDKGREIVQNAPQLDIDLDVEADGKPGYGSLLSVGAITPWGDTFYQEIKPTSEVWVPHQRQFCEDHGLTRERLLKEGLHPAEVMRELDEWTRKQQARYEKSGSVLTAFNASFDYPWIDLQMTRAKRKNPYGIAGYCIKSVAQVLNNNYDWRDTSKGKLPADIVPEGDFTHNALEDAEYQQKMHFALVGKIANQGAQTRSRPDQIKRQPFTETLDEDTTKSWHLDTNNELFTCGRCSNGRDCMEIAFGGESIELTVKEAKIRNEKNRRRYS